MTDEMRWSPDPPARPVPWLRIDLSEYASDPAAAREVVESAVGGFMAERRRPVDSQQSPIG